MKKKTTLSLDNDLEISLKLKILKEKSGNFLDKIPSSNSKRKAKIIFHPKLQKENLSEEGRLALKRKSEEKIRRKIKRKKCIAVINWLKIRYPKCFCAQEILPLKIGIQKDIISDLSPDMQISKCGIRKALSFYTRCYPYWKALVNHDYRYDLQGNPVESISKKHLEDAEAKLLFFLNNKVAQKKRISALGI